MPVHDVSHHQSVGIRGHLAKVYNGKSLDSQPFQDFPVVLDRLTQLKMCLAIAPENAIALEFGVYTGGSLRTLALANKARSFTGFDSFKGLPEPWHRSETSTYPAGHFKLKSLPLMPGNVALVAGFIEDTLPPWLAENMGAIGFVHIDVDLYSAAKFVLQSIKERLVDGAVIVFDELGDWKDEGVYPLWREGEWKAFDEWLGETGFSYRILSRGERFEAAVQVFKTPPKARTAAEELDHATKMWEQGAQTQAVDFLADALKAKPQWVGGHHKLAAWQTKLRRSNDALSTIDTIWTTVQQKPDHTVATDFLRLRAENLFRTEEVDRAWEDIQLFRERRPSHVGGLSLYAVVASRRRDHESATNAWNQAFQLSGSPDYREKAETEKLLSSIRPEFRRMKFSGLMIQHIVDERNFTTVLDIGSGAGEQAAALRQSKKIVTELDYGESHYFQQNPDGSGAMVGDFLKIDFSETYDCVIASHVLEHQLNVNAFLKKLHSVVREGGVVAISVPPLKHNIVGGHVTLWNAGLLLYNLVLAGFDCTKPWIRQYGYNISVVLKKRSISPAGLVFDNGDINRIAQFLPEGFAEGFNGDIRSFG